MPRLITDPLEKTIKKGIARKNDWDHGEHSKSDLIPHQDFYENELLPSSETLNCVLNGPPVNSFSSCKICCDSGLIFSDLNGSIDIKYCDCLARKKESWKKNKFDEIKIPSGYLDASSDKVLEIPNEVSSWIDHNFKGSLFLTGLPGRGKTFIGFFILFSFLKNKKEIPDNPCFYAKCPDIDEAFNYNEKTKFDTKKKNFKFERLIKLCVETEFLILDEIGRKKGEPDYLFNIVDHRISCGKPTIFISNHSFNKEQSLNSSTIDKLVGERIFSRLRACQHYHFDGEDRRDASSDIIGITDREKDEYMLPIPVLKQNDDEYHIMTWLTRNPAFEVVSTQKRKSLTYVDSQGVETDMDRPKPILHENVWVAGDILKIHGPICDHEDKKLYASLLKELSKNHTQGKYGLTLETSLNQILMCLGMKSSGYNVKKVKRQLNRLVRMSLSFSSATGPRWDGPLLTEIYFRGSSSDQRVLISFSQFMINFYKLHAYTSFDRNKSNELKGDGSSFYLFYSSHTRHELTISVEKCKKLLGIDKDFDKKEARKRVKKAVENLIIAGVMDPDKTYIKAGKVHTFLAPANINASQ